MAWCFPCHYLVEKIIKLSLRGRLNRVLIKGLLNKGKEIGMKIQLEYLISRYQKNCFLAALSILQNIDDANDAVQDTFVKYYTCNKDFKDEEHIKAWLLRVCINKSKDMAKSFWRKNQTSIEQLENEIGFYESDEAWVFEEVMRLPEKYRIVIHLFYYEDYSVRDIAETLDMKEASVRKRLSRGRAMLKDIIRDGGR